MTPVAQEIRPRFIATERRLKLVFHTVVNKEQVAAGQGRLFQGKKIPGLARESRIPENLSGKGQIFCIQLHQVLAGAEHAGPVALGTGQQPLEIELGGGQFGLVEAGRCLAAVIEPIHSHGGLA